MTSFAVRVHKLLKAHDHGERGCPEICTIVRDVEWQCHADLLWYSTIAIAHATVVASDSEAHAVEYTEAGERSEPISYTRIQLL